MTSDIPDFTQELTFSTSRSSGPGGQNVNKLETKVELRFSIKNSKILDEKQKQKIIAKLASKITGSEEIIITSQHYRSQIKNKIHCEAKFYTLLSACLKEEVLRIASRPPASVKENRIKLKKRTGILKPFRGNLKNKLSRD